MKGLASKIIVFLMVFSIMGFGGYAFAAQGTGYGHRYGEWNHHGPEWYHHGPECYHGGYGYPGYGYMMGNLSKEQIQKLNEQREAFFKSTKDLRQEIFQKRLALESELAKKNPDAKTALNLQKEISNLKSQIDQKRIEQYLEMKKIDPNLGERWMGLGMMGYGYGWRHRGYGGPMGYGPSYGYPCWK